MKYTGDRDTPVILFLGAVYIPKGSVEKHPSDTLQGRERALKTMRLMASPSRTLENKTRLSKPQRDTSNPSKALRDVKEKL